MTQRKRRRGRRFAGLVVGAVLAVPGVGWAWFAQGDAPLDGLRVEGIPLRSKDVPAAVLSQHERAWLETPLTIDAGAVVVHATRLQLGGRLTVGDALRDVVGLGRTGSPVADFRAWRAAQAGDLNVELRPYVDRDATLRYLGSLRAQVERSPIPSVIDEHGDATDGVPGLGLNLLDGLARIEEAIARSEVYVRIPTSAIAPPRDVAVRRDRATYVERVGAFETRYSPGRLNGRARNIEMAAAYLDGATIPPGGTLSFNEVVGERSPQRGFAAAVEIRQGRRVDGVGGGVCQVAATLHAAAFLGGFEILEHYPHSRNISYVEPGLDAAVVWNGKDFRMHNPFPYFVRVRATTPRGKLRVELLGPRPGPPVEWTSETVEQTEPREEREVDESLPSGEVQVVDEGEAGLVIRRTRTVHRRDGPHVDERVIRYPEVPRLLRVGPSLSALPTKPAVESNE